MPEAWTEHIYSRPPNRSEPPPQLQTWKPTRPPLPPPVPAPQASTSVRFRRVRPRQLEERNSKPASHRRPPALKPYQLKPKKGQEIFIEPPVGQKKVSPPQNAKQIKCIKKNLGKLNKKIRHSKRKYNNLISKRNPIKKKTKELKGLSKPEVSREPKSFNPAELEQAFYRAYRSYRINGRSKMDVDTFHNRIMQNLINLICREITNLNSARVQTNTYIRFRIEHDEGIIDDMVMLP